MVTDDVDHCWKVFQKSDGKLAFKHQAMSKLIN